MLNNSLDKRIAVQIAPLIPAHSILLIGLSGGVDSVVLLHLLQQLAPHFSWKISALHVHHGISANADAWADFCTRLCAKYAVPLRIERVNIAPLRKHGTEAAARKLRHTAFAVQECDFVVLAHHADDQAETLLLQLLRGSGVKGAAAMPVLSQSKWPVLSQSKWPVLSQSKWPVLSQSKRPAPITSGMDKPLPFTEKAGAKSVLRPLLHCSRQEILDYAAAHGLYWIEDESNADDSYPRNFMRHRLLPLLEEKFPAYRTTLARSAQHFAETAELLDDLARLDAPESFLSQGGGQGGEPCLEVSRLQSLSLPRAKNLLRYFLHSIGAPMPQTVQIDDMLQQLCDARVDAVLCVEYGGWQVRRYQGRVYVLRAPGAYDQSLVLTWEGGTELNWPALDKRLGFTRTHGAGISVAKLQHAPVTLRLRQGGETLRPHLNAATRTLKNLLQEHHISPWQRDRLPLLYCGEKLVCVVGVAVAAEYQAASDEPGVIVEFFS